MNILATKTITISLLKEKQSRFKRDDMRIPSQYQSPQVVLSPVPETTLPFLSPPISDKIFGTNFTQR